MANTFINASGLLEYIASYSTQKKMYLSDGIQTEGLCALLQL